MEVIHLARSSMRIILDVEDMIHMAGLDREASEIMNIAARILQHPEGKLELARSNLDNAKSIVSLLR